MSNLERARNGERLKVGVERESIKGIEGEYYLTTLPAKIISGLASWINMQIDRAVTHAIEDAPDPVYWRDLGPDEIRQEGDMVINGDRSPVGSTIGIRVGPATVQRPVRNEDM